MSKRTFEESITDAQYERTIDFAPAQKRTKLLVMPSSANKIGTYDEKTGITRSSNLLKPTMLLEGHKDGLYTCRFSDDGINIASGGLDSDILLWHVYGDCENHTTLKGHSGAIMQLEFDGSNEKLFSASSDNTGIIWDIIVGKQLKKIKEHKSIINSIYPTKKGLQYYATGSDDGTAKIFDIRMRLPIRTYDNRYQVTSVALMNNASKLFTGGIDNVIKVWDSRKESEPLYLLMKHNDTITSMKLSSDENYLLTNGMDNRLCIWDVRPFVYDNSGNIISAKTRELLRKRKIANKNNNNNNNENNNTNNSNNNNQNDNNNNNNNNEDINTQSDENNNEEKEDIDVMTGNENNDSNGDRLCKDKEKNEENSENECKDDANHNENNENENEDENDRDDSEKAREEERLKELELKEKRRRRQAAQQKNEQPWRYQLSLKQEKIHDSETESINRLYRVFGGAQHGNEKMLIKANWSHDGSRVCCGSSDKMAYIFDVESGKVLYRLPGHKGSVNEVDYHPKEPIIVSCSSDKTLFLGEL